MTRAIVTLCVLLTATPLAAQWLKHPTPGIPRTADGKPNQTAPAPRTADGKPDVSGIWQIDGLGYAFNIIGDKGPAMLPWAQTLYKQRADNYWKDDTDVKCLPPGPRAGLFSQNLLKIVETPGLTLILYESAPTRQIFTDGRELPRDPNPAWMGYSVGHWEGDTLIVESAGFNDRTWLDRVGHPHSEKLRVTERFRRVDFGHMQFQITYDDPETLTKPLSLSLAMNYAADTDMLENVCNEGNIDRIHLVGTGKGGIELSPEVLAKYVGRYEFREGSRNVPAFVGATQNVTLVNGQLYLNIIPLIPRSQTKFDSTGVAAEFVLDANGAVARLILSQPEGDGVYVPKR